MLRLYADLFVRLLAEINTIEVRTSAPIGDLSRIIPPEESAVLYAKTGVFGALCAQHDLKSTAQKCVRIHQNLEQRRMRVKYSEVNDWLRELRERLEDELRTELFIHLTSKEAPFYETPAKEWTEVLRRFSKIRHDVEESSKCFALGRYAASLFHVLLVAEFGVIKVAELFGVAGDKPGWGALDKLERIDKKKWEDKSPVEQKNSELLKKILPLMLSIKNEWRHKISHVDNKLEWMDTDFSPEVTERIISATLGFMENLAHDLPK